MSSSAETSTGARAVVLLSAGLDSTFNLYKAVEKFKICLVLSFNYGQKAAVRETERAKVFAQSFNLRHEIVDLPWFAKFTRTALLTGEAVPTAQDIEIDNLQRSLETAKSVWVPNRNGIFLNIAAGFAEGLNAEFVIPGFNREEAETFPDNSGAFLKALNDSFTFSTDSGVRNYCFSTSLNKTQIVEEAIKMKMPFEKLWPCYLPGPRWCGVCESCLRFKRAVKANGLDYNQLREASQ